MKKYICSFIITAILGIILGIITEFSLIYNVKWLISITQNELFWVVIAIFVAIFSKDYWSTEINTTTTLGLMTISYYIVRLIKSGYTNVDGIYWYGLQAICVGLYVGNIIYLIKEKIKGRKINNNIPKLSIIFMTMFLIIGIVIDSYSLYNNIFHIQPVYLICILSIIGYILGTILGILRNKRIK